MDFLKYSMPAGDVFLRTANYFRLADLYMRGRFDGRVHEESPRAKRESAVDKAIALLGMSGEG